MVIISIFAKIIFCMGGILMHYALGIGDYMRKISLGLFGLGSVDHLGSLSHSSYFSAKNKRRVVLTTPNCEVQESL